MKQGVCSPKLFLLFINEFTIEIRAKCLHGIQISPELIQLILFLFEDTVAVFSYTVIGLQNQLNTLCRRAQHLDLVENMKKSNVVIFRSGSHVARQENGIMMV